MRTIITALFGLLVSSAVSYAQVTLNGNFYGFYTSPSMSWIWTCSETNVCSYERKDSNGDLKKWCDYPNVGANQKPDDYPYPGNASSCVYALNGSGTIYQGTIVPYLENGAKYDHNSSCKITLSILKDAGYTREVLGQASGPLVGMIQRAETTEWYAYVPDCREGLTTLGQTWGYGSGISGKSKLQPNPYNKARICVWADDVLVGCSDYKSGGGTAPQPVYCDISVPDSLDHGTVQLSDVSTSTIREILSVSCSAKASLTLSFLGGTTSSSGVVYPLGGGIDTTVCVESDDGTCKGVSTASVGTNLTTLGLKSSLSGKNVTAGEHQGNVVLLIQQN